MNPLQEAKNRLFDSAMAATYRGFEGTVHTSDGKIGDVKDTSVVKGEITINTGNETLVFRGRDVGDLDTVLPEKPGPLGKPVNLLKEPTATL